MAKRTYRDKNGYKRKRRKRGTPEFATIEEYRAYIREKKVNATKMNPIKMQHEPKPEGIKQVEKLIDRLEDLIDPSSS